MNDHPHPHTPPPIPTSASPGPDTRPSHAPGSESGSAAVRPLGEAPGDDGPIAGLPGAIEAMLRHPRRVLHHLRHTSAAPLLGALFAVTLFGSLIYGVVVGSFSGEAQYWAAPVKVAGGLLISALICLPSLYIFACLGGSDVRLMEVFGLVLGLLAMMTLLLLGFAPVAWVFSQSTTSLAAMGALHLAFWGIACHFGIRFLHAGLKQLGGRPSGLRVWAVVFVLVMLQMTTALRPLVGTSDRFLSSEKKFFLKHWMEQLDDSPVAARRPADAPRP